MIRKYGFLILIMRGEVTVEPGLGGEANISKRGSRRGAREGQETCKRKAGEEDKLQCHQTKHDIHFHHPTPPKLKLFWDLCLNFCELSLLFVCLILYP